MNKIPEEFDTINVLIMPSDYCNLSCVYCFNGRKTCTERYNMSYEVLEHTLKIILENYKDVTFIWHGGEPLALGIEFYKKVIEIEKKYEDKVTIRNLMQSNLTLLTPEFAKFLYDNNFRIGGSYDDSANDKTRHATKAILKGYTTLKEVDEKASLISVTTNYNVNNLIKDYEWHKQKRIPYSLNLYVTEKENRENNELSIPINTYISKYKELFDYWLYDTKCTIPIRTLDIFAEYMILKKRYLCSQTSCLGKWAGVLYDGTIVPCNRTFPKEYNFGNVMDYKDFHEAYKSEGFIKLLEASIERREKCKNCEAYGFCRGGCNNDALIDGNIRENGGYNCQVKKQLYTYTKSKIDELKRKNLDELENVINPYVFSLLKNRRKEKTIDNR